MAKVSVVIPVYNAEQTISRCLDALCAQTYDDFEAICVDDGSKDSSLEILKKYSQKDSRIIALSQKNSGPGKARNYAISKSTGKYLMFCDADDWYEPQMIEEMVKTIEEQNVDIVMCDCNVVDLSDGKVRNHVDIAWHHLKRKGFVKLDSNIKDTLNCVIWNKIFRKDIMDKYGINYPDKYEHDDAMFFWKYIFACSTYFGLDKPLYNYILGNPNSISGKYKIKAITPHTFDFVLCMEDLYKFIMRTNLEAHNDYSVYIGHNYRTIQHYYNLLSEDAKHKAHKIIRKIVKKYLPLLSKYNENYIYLAKYKHFDEFDLFLTKGIKNNISFAEEIFSVKNEGQKKVLRIFGLKYKFKNAKLQQKEDIKKIMKAIDNQAKITKELMKRTEELQLAIKELENRE